MKLHVLILMVAALMLSACQIRIDQSTVINGDGSGSLAIVVAADEELRELFEASGQDLKTIAEGLPAGFATEAYLEGDLEGIRAETEFANLDELNELLGGELGGGQVADAVSVTRDGDVFDFRASIGDVDEQLAGLDGVGGFLTPELFDEVVDITISTRLPGELLEHNADEASEAGELRWHVTSSSAGDLMASSTVKPPVSIGLMILAVAGVAALGLGAALLLSRRQSLDSSPLG